MESDLTGYGAEWLRRRGLGVCMEVVLPTGEGRLRPVDLVGWSNTRIVAVEMKRTLNRSALDQCLSCRGYADEVWALVMSATPRMSEDARESGIGVLIPSDDGSCEVVVETAMTLAPVANGMLWRDRLGRAPDRTVAGIRKGVVAGDYALERESLREWFAVNPGASWRMAFRCVPSSASDWKALRARHRKAVSPRPRS